jgi:hypothetical protein
MLSCNIFPYLSVWQITSLKFRRNQVIKWSSSQSSFETFLVFPRYPATLDAHFQENTNTTLTIIERRRARWQKPSLMNMLIKMRVTKRKHCLDMRDCHFHSGDQDGCYWNVCSVWTFNDVSVILIRRMEYLRGCFLPNIGIADERTITFTTLVGVVRRI